MLYVVESLPPSVSRFDPDTTMLLYYYKKQDPTLSLCLKCVRWIFYNNRLQQALCFVLVTRISKRVLYMYVPRRIELPNEWFLKHTHTLQKQTIFYILHNPPPQKKTNQKPDFWCSTFLPHGKKMWTRIGSTTSSDFSSNILLFLALNESLSCIQFFFFSSFQGPPIKKDQWESGL